MPVTQQVSITQQVSALKTLIAQCQRDQAETLSQETEQQLVTMLSAIDFTDLDIRYTLLPPLCELAKSTANLALMQGLQRKLEDLAETNIKNDPTNLIWEYYTRADQQLSQQCLVLQAMLDGATPSLEALKQVVSELATSYKQQIDKLKQKFDSISPAYLPIELIESTLENVIRCLDQHFSNTEPVQTLRQFCETRLDELAEFLEIDESEFEDDIDEDEALGADTIAADAPSISPQSAGSASSAESNSPPKTFLPTYRYSQAGMPPEHFSEKQKHNHQAVVELLNHAKRLWKQKAFPAEFQQLIDANQVWFKLHETLTADPSKQKESIAQLTRDCLTMAVSLAEAGADPSKLNKATASTSASSSPRVPSGASALTVQSLAPMMRWLRSIRANCQTFSSRTVMRFFTKPHPLKHNLVPPAPKNATSVGASAETSLHSGMPFSYTSGNTPG